MTVASGIQIASKFVVCALWQHALLVEKGHDSGVLNIDQIQHVLIVRELNELPHDPFLFVLLLFQLEHVSIELLLECLVGVVDAKLFEGIVFEGFESEYIQDTNGCSWIPIVSSTKTLSGVRFGLDARVDLFDDKVKDSPVNCLDQSLAGLSGIFDRQHLHDYFVCSIDRSLGQGRCESLEGNTKQRSASKSRFRFIEYTRFPIVARCKTHVTRKQNGRHQSH
mmetsp:Transcript_7786/g.19280  ORF Transcript_7786/g.19280 Transcript_7786/m.19280 type:complete len:223 (-) Transcript_7786:1480-2148(-)